MHQGGTGGDNAVLMAWCNARNVQEMLKPGFPVSLPAVFMDLGSAQCRGGSAEEPEDGEVTPAK